MNRVSTTSVLQVLRKLLGSPAVSEASDGQLLARFVRERDESAFALLVARHGRMVLSVCRRVLADEHDAEDAFQATFLVLLRKASALTRPESVGPWLYGVACRTATRARARRQRRRMKEALADLTLVGRQETEGLWHDLGPILDAEIRSLPEKYRTLFVLCHLEDCSNEDAARLVGCPVGTVQSRLFRARERLRRRLARRGITLTGAGLIAVLDARASAAFLPASLAHATAGAAVLLIQGGSPAALSTHVISLVEGVLQTMLLSKLKTTFVVLVLAATAGAGLWTLNALAGPGQQPSPDIAQALMEEDSDQQPGQPAAHGAKADSPDSKLVLSQKEKERYWKEHEELERHAHDQYLKFEDDAGKETFVARRALLRITDQIASQEREDAAERARENKRIELMDNESLKKGFLNPPRDEVSHHLQKLLADALQERRGLEKQRQEQMLTLREAYLEAEEKLQAQERRHAIAREHYASMLRAAQDRLANMHGYAVGGGTGSSNRGLEQKLDRVLEELAQIRRELHKSASGSSMPDHKPIRP